MKAFITGFIITTLLLITANNLIKTKDHKYAVLLEVAQMKLEGQADMEVIMNAKSTTDTTEINAALDQLRKVK